MTAQHREIRGGRRSRLRARLQLLTAGVLALATVLGAQLAWAKKADAARDARLALIKGLAHEVAVTKVPLPRGKKGIFLDAQGQVDQAKADAELGTNGAAIRAGMPIQITKIEFKAKRIVFEINGGGKKGKKWYQRIEIGIGGTTRPIVPDAPVLAYGSSVSLTFAEKVPPLTVEQAKKLLGAVLDFERRSPTVLYTPAVPPEVKEAIKKHEVIVGMDRDAVLSSKGPPDRKVREVREGVEMEDWIYGLPPHVLFVTFDGDTVVAVRQH
jgi:hypothetical protein